jgi:hypothetical protein
MLGVALLASASWAQSNTDLPALPPGSDAGLQLPPPPTVETPAQQQPSVAEVLAPEPQAASSATSETSATQNLVPVSEAVIEAAPPNQAVSPQQTEAMSPAAEPSATQEIKKDFKPSYGEFEQSLLYSAQDIDRMKKVLTSYESIKRPEGSAKPVKDEFTELLNMPVPTISEPENYPTYYMSSIVYRSPKDWLFWMNGTKYTPKKMPGGMKILAMSPRAALFAWEPEYIEQAKTRFERELIDTSIPKHIKAHNSYVKYDEKNNRFTVSIAPNQSFVSAAFAVYEGKHADKAVPEMPQEMRVNAALNDVPAVVSPQNFRDPDAELKATMQQQQRMSNNLGQLAPRNNPNAQNNTSSAPGGVAVPPPAAPAPTIVDVPAPVRADLEPPPTETAP